MELRLRFNEDVQTYDRFRPGYPDALFDAVISRAGIGPGSRLLEIGIGTGQAAQPFLDLGCDVTAIELGEELCAYSAQKFRSYPNFHVIAGDFMQVETEIAAYDLIYSATAFHWLPARDACAKVLQSLRPGGTAALFWNHPFVRRKDDPSNAASEAVYERLRPSGKEFREFSPEDCEPWKTKLVEAGFLDVTAQLFRRTRTLCTEDYIGLLNTYSDHRALEPGLKTRFETEMRQAVDAAGGQIRIYDTIDLYLSSKP